AKNPLRSPSPCPSSMPHSRDAHPWCRVGAAARGGTPMNPVQLPSPTKNAEASGQARETLTLRDNRTGKSYEIPITHNTIRATDLRQIKVAAEDFGVVSYDPAFNNTASCISRITYIDGEAGILRYRGYPIEELAEKSTYLETAYLLLHGALPTKSQLDD